MQVGIIVENLDMALYLRQRLNPKDLAVCDFRVVDIKFAIRVVCDMGIPVIVIHTSDIPQQDIDLLARFSQGAHYIVRFDKIDLNQIMGFLNWTKILDFREKVEVPTSEEDWV
jgi:2-methylaconitate cis-trans-isomerase PrpF